MNPKETRRGQAIVLVTLSLIAMMGLMGLAVDFGWSFYVEKWEQAAADAAALAAAKETLKIGGTFGPYAPTNSRTVDRNGSTTTISIAANSQGNPVQCPSSGTLPSKTASTMTNVDIACIYALEHGFEVAPGTRQNVTVENANTSPPPTAPGITSLYWVTVRVAQQIPQLFSAVLGNTEGLTAAIGTAAIVDAEVIGSLLLINREGDCLNLDTDSANDCGLNFYSGGSTNLDIKGGIIIASGADGTTNTSASGDVAAEINSTGDVYSDYTDIRDPGTFIDGSNSNQGKGGGLFRPTPTTQVPDGEAFLDPFRNRGQPPLYDPNGAPPRLQVWPIPGGTISASMLPNLPPGVYYASDPTTGAPINKQISIVGTHKFAKDLGGQAGVFEDYYFIGGLETASNVNLTLAPGRYVFVGVPAGQGTASIDIANSNPAITDGLPVGEQGAGGTAGTILINAGKNYPGLSNVLNNVIQGGTYNVSSAILNNSALGLDYGGAVIKSGNTSNSYVRLHGLNDKASTFPSYLQPWRSVVYWQDRQNSVVRYDPKYFDPASADFNKEGHIYNDGNPSTPAPGYCDGDFSIGCVNPDYVNKNTDRTALELNAGQAFSIWGVIYQPRGSFTSFQGSPTDVGALQVITGALKVQGGGNLLMGQLSEPAITRVVALVH